MKKVFKKGYIFSFILGAIVFGSVGVYAAYSVLADNIGYTPKDSTWKKANGEDITNVKDAIDELYNASTHIVSTGEAWLKANTQIKSINNLSIYRFYNLDLSNIKTITYHFEGNITNTVFIIFGTDGQALYESDSTTPTQVNIEQYKDNLSNASIQLNIAPGTFFYLDEYTK